MATSSCWAQLSQLELRLAMALLSVTGFCFQTESRSEMESLSETVVQSGRSQFSRMVTRVTIWMPCRMTAPFSSCEGKIMASVACKFDSSCIPQQTEVVSSWQRNSLEFAPAAEGTEEEILSALAVPTLTNVVMAGFIRDNGLVSTQNRGRFYVCRNTSDKLEGVALCLLYT